MGNIFILAFVALAAVVSAATLPKETQEIPLNSQILKNMRIDEGNADARKEVVVGGKTFRAIVSDTNELRERGLSGRKGLADDEVMLFIFEKSDRYGFWMRDMLFPIDILWASEDLKVVSFEKNVSPQTFPKVFYPAGHALYVLEFNSGTLDALNVRTGDSIRF